MEGYYKEIQKTISSNLSDLEKEQIVTDILIKIKNDGIRIGQTRTIESVLDQTERLRLAVFTQLGY